MYYLQYLGFKLSPFNLQNVFLVVNAAHSQQVGTAGSKRQGYTNYMECISAYGLYYVMVTLVRKTP